MTTKIALKKGQAIKTNANGKVSVINTKKAVDVPNVNGNTQDYMSLINTLRASGVNLTPQAQGKVHVVSFNTLADTRGIKIIGNGSKITMLTKPNGVPSGNSIKNTLRISAKYIPVLEKCWQNINKYGVGYINMCQHNVYSIDCFNGKNAVKQFKNFIKEIDK